MTVRFQSFGDAAGAAAIVGEVERPEAAVAQAIMAVACLVFLFIGMKSFRDARKAREAAAAS